MTRSLVAIGSLLFALAVPAHPSASELPGTRRAAQAQWQEEGLRALEVRGLDVVYAPPGASLAGYSRVLIQPVSVQFRKDWLRDQEFAKRMQLRPREVQRIQDRVALVVRQEVAAELGKHGIQIVEQPGPGVLELALAVVELDMNAPELPLPGRIATYAVSAGEMSLVGSVRDAQSGATLLRVFDRATAYETRWPHRITMVETVAEQRQAARSWARALRAQLANL